MLRRKWPFFTLTEILSIHGTLSFCVSSGQKKSTKFIFLDFSKSGEYADIEIGDQFFKKTGNFPVSFHMENFCI